VKKTILVTAIAAVMSVPAAALESDMYGNIRLSLRSDSDARIDSSKLIIGWKGSEDLGNGYTASFKLEMEHDDANTKGSGWDNDRSWVAIGGDFGKVIAGREDTFDGWAFAGTDVFAINGQNTVSAGNELDNGIQYRGSAGGFQFGIGAELFSSGGTQVTGDTDYMNTTYGFSYEGNNWQVGAHGSDADSDAGFGPGTPGISGQIAPGDTSLDIGGYYTLGNFTLGATLSDNGSDTDEDALNVVLAFPLGPCGALVGLESGDSLDAASATGSDGDIVTLAYNCKTGATYYGWEYEDNDDNEDELHIFYYGIRW